MSIRTLLEINHDCWGEIDDNRNEFVVDVLRYLGSGSDTDTQRLLRYGIRIAATRHHSEQYDPRVLAKATGR